MNVSKNNNLLIHIYGSLDNIEWKLVGGGKTENEIVQDVMLRKTYVSCRYFIFVIAGDAKNVILDRIDVEMLDTFVSKLR